MGDTDGMMVTRRFAACATGGASSWLSEVLTLTSLVGTSAHCAITSCHQCGTSFFEYFFSGACDQHQWLRAKCDDRTD